MSTDEQKYIHIWLIVYPGVLNSVAQTDFAALTGYFFPEDRSPPYTHSYPFPHLFRVDPERAVVPDGMSIDALLSSLRFVVFYAQKLQTKT